MTGRVCLKRTRAIGHVCHVTSDHVMQTVWLVSMKIELFARQTTTAYRSGLSGTIRHASIMLSTKTHRRQLSCLRLTLEGIGYFAAV